MQSVGTLRRVRFRAICSGFRTEIFEKISQPQNLTFEIAPKSEATDDAQPCHDYQRYLNTVQSVGTLRRVIFCAICSGFQTEILEKFSRAQNSTFDIPALLSR